MSNENTNDCVIKHKKPDAFYPEFFRKGEGSKTTHFCPGCGHGTASKLIAEAISDFGIKDRTIFCSPVGCSVFQYYYFDCGGVQCSHGRAPAVATGIRRTLDDAIIISYQGDGDLAGIGIGAIIHAANRGENITVFFINNAIYGMTGGQMAPTTLVGQKTVTTPSGRSIVNEGFPIHMAEMISTLTAPVFVERVSLGNAARVMKARKAIRQAIDNQIQKKGFSFVEILSPCPVNWKMTPPEACKWLIDNLEPVYPVQNFCDKTAQETPKHDASLPPPDMKEIFGLNEVTARPVISKERALLNDQYVKIAGFGGQGVMSAGILLAKGAIAEGLNASWLPSYGPEMRGGTAYANVIVSREVIGAPIVDHPNVLIALNAPSLDAFEEHVEKGGLIIVNSSLINRKVKRTDLKTIYAPVSEIANDAGLNASVNVIALTVYITLSGVMDIETLKKTLSSSVKKTMVDANIKAIDAGFEYCRKNLKGGA